MYRKGVFLTYKVGRCLLRELLHNADMSQVELAEIMNIKVQQISKYIRDERKMSLQTAFNISAILKCKVEDLYDLIEVGDKE